MENSLAEGRQGEAASPSKQAETSSNLTGRAGIEAIAHSTTGLAERGSEEREQLPRAGSRACETFGKQEGGKDE